MKVWELINVLSGMDPHAEVICANDEECNSYTAICSPSEMHATYDGYSYDVRIKKLTPALIASGFADEDLFDDTDKPFNVVVL